MVYWILYAHNLKLSFVRIVRFLPYELRINIKKQKLGINHAPMIVHNLTVTTVTVTLNRLSLYWKSVYFRP